jgi:hypothetical protein
MSFYIGLLFHTVSSLDVLPVEMLYASMAKTAQETAVLIYRTVVRLRKTGKPK